MITSNYQVDGDIYSYADKFFCNSQDDKPSNRDAKDGLINGAILEETDTGKTYIFDKKANKWTEKAEGGGTGGSTTLAGLTDVDITNPSDGQTLVFDATSSKWVNGSRGGGGFTVLQGTFSDSGGLSTITLDITASALFTLLQTSAVSVAWTQTADGFTDSYITPIDKCQQSVEDDNTVYVFQFLGGLYLAPNLSASDSVVFEMT